jgi:hypothetical protein
LLQCLLLRHVWPIPRIQVRTCLHIPAAGFIFSTDSTICLWIEAPCCLPLGCFHGVSNTYVQRSDVILHYSNVLFALHQLSCFCEGIVLTLCMSSPCTCYLRADFDMPISVPNG